MFSCCSTNAAEFLKQPVTECVARMMLLYPVWSQATGGCCTVMGTKFHAQAASGVDTTDVSPDNSTTIRAL